MSTGIKHITKTPAVEKTKEKDPKKVAAGKALAEKNRAAREAFAREKKAFAEANEEAARNAEAARISREVESTNLLEEKPSKGWFSGLSLTTLLTLLGIGFSAADMFMRYRNQKESVEKDPENDHNINIPPHTTRPSTSYTASRPSTSHTAPKIGMA